MPNNNIQKFELPRLDWYDQEGIDEPTGEIIGRIYKDALIENFNAIEDKSLELQKLNVLDISIPEPSGFVYNDSDLETSDSNQVVNLKSLVKILDLEGYPLKLSFNNTTCTECKFYKLLDNGNDVKIVTVKNINTKATSTQKYVYIDIQNETVVSSASSNLSPSRYKFIGMFINNKIIHQRSQLYPNSTTIKGS